MPLELVLLFAAIAALTLAVWQPIVAPRYALGAPLPMGLSWCTAGASAGLQVILPLVWYRGLWCLRASAAIGRDGVHVRLHVVRRA